MAQISVVKKSELEGALRLDAEYYQPKYLQLNRSLMTWKGGNVKRLSAIGTVEYGFMPMEDYVSPDEGEPLIRVTNILGNLLVDMNDVKFIRKGLASSRKRVKHGDILVVQCGDTTGKVAFISNELDNLVFPSFCLRVRTQELVPEYIAAFLNSRLGQLQIMRGITYATVRPNTTKPNIQNILVPIPPEDVQHQVATVASSAFAETTQTKVLYLQAEQLLLDEIGFKDLDLSHQLYYTVPLKKTKEAGRLDAEHFQPKYERLEERLLGYKGGAKVLGSLIQPITNGYDCREFVSDGVPYLRVGDVRVGWLDLSSVERISPHFIKKDVALSVGDILFTRKGTYGVASQVKLGEEGCIISSEIMRLRLLPGSQVSPDYLALFLNSVAARMQVEKYVHGFSNFSITQADIQKLIVPLPARPFQLKVGDLVTQSLEARQKARQLLEDAKRKVEAIIEGKSSWPLPN